MPYDTTKRGFRSISSLRLTFLLSGIFLLLYNTAMYRALFTLIDIHQVSDLFFLLSLSALLLVITSLVLVLFILPYVAKPFLIMIFCTAACVSYFMNTYGIVIHATMVQNTFETDAHEVAGLLNPTLFIYLALLGLLPSYLLLRTRIVFGSFKQELIGRLKLWAIGLLAIVVLIAPLSAQYASFFRNNKNVRQMANPVNFIYATSDYAFASNKAVTVSPLGEDAHLNAQGKSHSKPTLLVLVVGETARADHFSINGYERPTTPLLAQQPLINYSSVYSCGTETAVSVPCMFSGLGRSDYSDKKAKSREGLLDVLKHGGYSVLWRDNNSGCKGTCNRVDYESMNDLTTPGLCNDRECFDLILLQDLTQKMASMNGNKVLVLHQKGSHGPDYYHRVPEDKYVFTPVCRDNELQNCTHEELVNSFDNTIHYTDEFLNSTIEWLKQQSADYDTALIYLSDHGESLGEKSLYLHGMPYLIAPEEQKYIPFFFWFSEGFVQADKISRECLTANTHNNYSQDNLFHTVLGLLNLDTSVYKAELDMVKACRAD